MVKGSRDSKSDSSSNSNSKSKSKSKSNSVRPRKWIVRKRRKKWEKNGFW